MYEEPQELKEFNPEATLNEAGAAPSNLEYKRSNQEILRENQVEIIFLSVGCVIKVGCKEIPFFNKIAFMLFLSWKAKLNCVFCFLSASLGTVFLGTSDPGATSLPSGFLQF